MSRYFYKVATSEGTFDVAYGLDLIPIPGFFVEVKKTHAPEDVYVFHLDQRPMMSLNIREGEEVNMRVGLGEIVEVLERFHAPKEHVWNIVGDLPPEGMGTTEARGGRVEPDSPEHRVGEVDPFGLFTVGAVMKHREE